jgi:hypothetical protein
MKMMKYIISSILILTIISAKAQFPGTDSLRNYNNKYITNNPATAFTNLRLNTLIRGIIDFIDTARAGTGGGGVIGIDTVFAVNDSTIRYRKNGVFRQFTLKGVYDSRRKVDTIYKTNDTTIAFTINGSVRTVIFPGGTSSNLANADQTATGNRTHNWNDKWLFLNSIKAFDLNTDHQDPNHPGNRFKFQFYSDSTIDNYPLRLMWGLKNINEDFTDSSHFELASTANGTYMYHHLDGGGKLVEFDLSPQPLNPYAAIYANGNGKNSYFQFGATTIIQPNDSLLIMAVPAANADSLLGVRALSNGVNTVVKFPKSAVGGGGGGSANLSNVGAGYRWVKTADGQIYTVANSNTVKWDSTSNSNSLTAKVDTSLIATQYDLTQIVSGINQLTGDVIAGPGTGSQATTIAANAVSNSKFRQSAGLSVVGTSGNSLANVADITAGTDNQVLRRSGTTLGFGAVNIASSNAVTGQLAEDNLQTFSPYPAEASWGTLYERSTWQDFSDFLPLGTASLGLTGSGYLTITATTEDYTPKILIKPGWATGLPKWKVTYKYRHTAFGSPSNWFGSGIKSKVDHDGANFGYMFFTGAGSGGGGNTFFSSETGTVIVNSGAGVSKSLNDLMEATVERNDTVMTYTLRNVTTSSSTQTVTYTFPADNSNILPNVGNWFWMYNANGGTVQIEYLKIESQTTVAANLLFMGNSKTAIASTTFATRPVNQVQATYPTAIYSAGSAERMYPDMFFKKEELLRLNPSQVVLMDVWSNDKRSGLYSNEQIIENIIKLENYWKAGGTTVYYAPLPEDSTSIGANGLTYFWQWLSANRSSVLLPTWDSLRRSGSDNRIKAIYTSDGVHLTEAGNNKIVEAIIASGKLSTISPNRRTDRRTVDNNVRTVGDSTGLAFDWNRVANNVPRVNSDYNVTKSNIWDDNTNVIVSTSRTPSVPLGAILFNVNGAFSSYGNSGGMYLFDRDDPNKYFAFYGNSNFLRLNRTGTDFGAISNAGKLTIGNPSDLMLDYGALRIRKDYSIAASQGVKGLALNIDSATITVTSSTAYGNGAIASIAPYRVTSTGGAASFDRLASLHIGGVPYAGTDVTIASPLALNVEGKARFSVADSVSSPANMVTINPNTKALEIAAVPSGGGLTGSGTSGRVAYWNGSSSLTSDADLLFNGSVLSIGTTNTQGQLNTGGDKNLTTTGAGSYFAGATYTDQVTSASGTASSYGINYFGPPTIAAANSSVTFPNIYTVMIAPPSAGTNATITNRYALATSSNGHVQFGGNVEAQGALNAATSFRRKITTYTTTSTISVDDNVILVNATGGNVTLTLPAASSSYNSTLSTGISYIIKRIDNSGNTVTIQASTDTLDGTGSGSFTLSFNQSREVIATSTSSWIIN